jgi:hypothetical protein
MKNPKHFYNTINESGQTLLDFESKAISLEELVYVFFQRKTIANWCDAYKFINGSHEISIKRSISNLANAGKLIKTKDMVMGIYGKKVHLYKINEQFIAAPTTQTKEPTPMEELFEKFGHLLPDIQNEYLEKELKHTKRK